MTTSDPRMLEGFDKFIARINERYQEARDCLEVGDFIKAHQILVHIAQSHAQTSLSLRNRLIKTGQVRTDGK